MMIDEIDFDYSLFIDMIIDDKYCNGVVILLLNDFFIQDIISYED